MSNNQDIHTQQSNIQESDFKDLLNPQSLTSLVLNSNAVDTQNNSLNKTATSAICSQCGAEGGCGCNPNKQENLADQSTTNGINNSVESEGIHYHLSGFHYHGDEIHFHSHEFHNHEVHFDALPGVETVAGGEGNNFTEVASATATPLDLSQTFFLNSNPGAKHTIYLDFDGHTTTGTFWNSQYNLEEIFTSAYDFDGDTSSFSNSELTRIQNIWQRVAEDFMPFDVNVTTQDPGADALRRQGFNDEQWGTRIAIGGSSRDWFSNSNSGGVAYIGSFNWSTDTPVFVFEENLSNGNEKFVAEAITHEVGHSLYLDHDGISSNTYYSGSGSGDTGWAPIMGTSYYKNLTQWSKGEYNNANNQEDDLAIITRRNGFGYRSDDHGDSNGSATPLSISNRRFSGAGIIEQNTDYDVFSFFTDTGTVSLDILPAQLGANLDILAQLYDSQGTLIDSSNPLDLLSANFNLNLEAGQYYLHITGTGKDGAYSDYGSLGQYSISGNIAAIEPDYLSIEATQTTKEEGDDGATPFTFTVTRTGNLSVATKVDYVVRGNGANSVNGEDFVGGVLPRGTIDFEANETSKVITINVNGDLVNEQDEGFTVTLQNPGGQTLLNTSSVSTTIINDDVEVNDNEQLPLDSREILGSNNQDKLIGSSSNEIFIGLGGNDDITTGGGKDVVVLNSTSEGLDYVLDFDPNLDQVDVSGLLDTIGYTGSDPFADNILRPIELSFGGSTHVRIDSNIDGDYSGNFDQLVFFSDLSLAELDLASNFITTTDTQITPDQNLEIIGSNNQDKLIGSSSNEIFIGLGGNDDITTGGGQDVVVLNSTSEGLDYLLDFDPNLDQVDVSGLLDTIGYTGSDPFADNILRPIELSFGGSTHVRIDSNIDGNYSGDFDQLVFFPHLSLAELDLASNFITITAQEILGSDNQDKLIGSSSNEIFIGLGGNDDITTGGGKDVVVLNSTSEGLDYVLDFDPNLDQVDVSGLLDTIGYTGSDPFADNILRPIELSFGGSTHVRIDSNIDGDYSGNFDQLVFFSDLSLAELDLASNFITTTDTQITPDQNLEIIGSNNQDKLIGSSSNEIFIGLGGNDDITTGGGQDVVVLNSTSEGLDYLLDFDPNLDQVDVSGLLDTIGYTGSDPFADNILRPIELSFGGSTHVRIDSNIDGDYSGDFDQLVFFSDMTIAQLDLASNFIV